MSELRLAIAGAGGRMGAANVLAATQDPAAEIAGALERTGSDSLGEDVGVRAGVGALGIAITDDSGAALAGANALIDFTSPKTSVMLAQQAAKLGLVHVIGTTGATEDDVAAIRAAGEQGARIVMAGNMSLGVNLLTVLVEQAAAALGVAYDIEVLEMHHRHKVDAPSGTALMLGEAAARGRGIALADNAVRSRDGITGPRPDGAIGFATLRGGSVVGEHSVILAGPGERIEIGHRAQDRSIFANGALTAARWALGQPAGFYTMRDVLGL